MKELFLKNPDGFNLSVKIFEPEHPVGKLLIINSATGVKQQVYFSFAKYMSQNGFTVITYDYSGIGESKPKEMKNFKSSMRVWGSSDFQTLTEFIKKEYPQEEKFCLGHSVGALILGMNADSAIFRKFVFVATQDAYLGNLKFNIAVTALLGFGIALPITTTLFGFFPAHWFGLGETLPKGVAYDWRTLILHPKSTARLYEKNEVDFSKNLTQNTLILHAEDDPWVTEKGMKNLLKNVYPNLHKNFREIEISESEKKEIGHINFFRSFNNKLWKIVLDDLQEKA